MVSRHRDTMKIESENGRVPRYNANGDLLRDDTPQQAYCSVCRGFVRPSGARVPYDSDEIILWLECDRCMFRRLEEEAEEEERRRREEELRRPRECGWCGELFVPGKPWSTFCCDEHRWLAAQRRRKVA